MLNRFTKFTWNQWGTTTELCEDLWKITIESSWEVKRSSIKDRWNFFSYPQFYVALLNSSEFTKYLNLIRWDLISKIYAQLIQASVKNAGSFTFINGQRNDCGLNIWSKKLFAAQFDLGYVLVSDLVRLNFHFPMYICSQ